MTDYVYGVGAPTVDRQHAVRTSVRAADPQSAEKLRRQYSSLQVYSGTNNDVSLLRLRKFNLTFWLYQNIH